jgi:hypothetical protein
MDKKDAAVKLYLVQVNARIGPLFGCWLIPAFYINWLSLLVRRLIPKSRSKAKYRPLHAVAGPPAQLVGKGICEVLLRKRDPV